MGVSIQVRRKLPGSRPTANAPGNEVQISRFSVDKCFWRPGGVLETRYRFSESWKRSTDSENLYFVLRRIDSGGSTQADQLKVSAQRHRGWHGSCGQRSAAAGANLRQPQPQAQTTTSTRRGFSAQDRCGPCQSPGHQWAPHLLQPDATEAYRRARQARARFSFAARTPPHAIGRRRPMRARSGPPASNSSGRWIPPPSHPRLEAPISKASDLPVNCATDSSPFPTIGTSTFADRGDNAAWRVKRLGTIALM